ncbi:MAG: shikimate kinase [Bacteroidales bacterium]|nr:shikimate kinase [Candidatus Cryptobacteroides fimicaballi]
MIVSLTGFMGSGKSSVGAALAALMNFRFIDLDEYVREHEGLSVAELLAQGEERFRMAESVCLREILAKADENTVLALGGGTVAYGQNLQLILSSTRCVYLQASLPVIGQRLAGQTAQRPLYNPETAPQLYESRLKYYRQAEFTVDTDDLPPARVAELVSELVTGKHTD